jgi:hypothetical protein
MSKASLGKVRATIFDRDNHQCVMAHTTWALSNPCYGPLTLQHRAGRGMGGSKKLDAPNNLTTLCAGHNYLAECNADFAAYCTAKGVSVRRSIADQIDMSSLPLEYSDGWHLLSGLSRFPIPDSTANAIMSEIYGEN